MKEANPRPTAPLTLEVRVHPRSGKQGLWKESNGRLQAALRAVPEGGKANDELVRLVAGHLGIARSNVELWKGHKSRQKVLRVWGMDAGQLELALGRVDSR